MNKKNSWKYNADGFINLRGYFSHCNKNWRTSDNVFILNAPRNNGKSYGMWDIIENDIWIKSNYTERIAYCRTNKEKTMKAIENFNSKFRGKYFMNSTKIYKVKYDDKGKEIMKDRIEIGSVVMLNQFENYKSGFFENYRLFFWDEYNEINRNKGQFFKFIDLLKTIKRKNSPFNIFLIGNKVNANNDILVNLQIDVKEIKNPDEDYIFNNGNNIYFIEIGNKTFKHINPEDDIVNVLASYNEETNNYLNNGTYFEDDEDNVLIYDKYVKNTAKVLKYFSYDEDKYEFGTFVMNNTLHYYFREINTIPKDYFAYSLSVLGSMRVQNSGLLDEKTLIDLADDLKIKAKHKRLWYCSFDTKMIIEPFIQSYCRWE